MNDGHYNSDALRANPYTKMAKILKIIVLISVGYLFFLPCSAAAETLVYAGKVSGAEGLESESGVGIQTESVNFVVYKLGTGQLFKVVFGGSGQMVAQRKGYITCGNYVYSAQEDSTDIWRECWNYLGNSPVWVDEYTLLPER